MPLRPETLISVLDLAPVTTATPPALALRRSVELAQAADAFGYHRFWVAEHHNLPSVACSATEILITMIASATPRIRVGSGGVMLPNHAPLMVAERFKTLEAFFPGRIDLGLGRAPGTDQVTSYALRRRQTQSEADDFLERLQELLMFETGSFPERHAYRSVVAMPSDTAFPPIFLLGSSDYSAHLSARMGLGFAFAHHFASYDAVAALRAYRSGFSETGWSPAPHAILGVAAIAAETHAEAERLSSSADLNWVRRAKGEYRPLSSPEEAEAHTMSQNERALIAENRSRLFVGTPDRIAERLTALVDSTGADEVMIVSPIFDSAARIRSYKLMAEALTAHARRPVDAAAVL